MTNIIQQMHDDEIRQVVSNDDLVCFASNLFEKLGRSGYQQISQRLRNLATPLKEADCQMIELTKASQFPDVVKMTRKVFGYDKDNLNPHTDLPMYENPSKFMKLGGELRQLAALKKADGRQHSV